MSRLIQLAVVGALIIWGKQNLAAQPKEPTQPKVIPRRASEFDFQDDGVARALLDARRAAILRCAQELRKREPMTFEEKQATLRAAWLLGELQADDQQAVEALLDNLTLAERYASEDHPLASLPAARSLARIGSHSLKFVHEYLTNQRTDQELRVIAFVLVEIDGIDLARSRVALEQRRYEGFPPAARHANAQAVRNWRQVGDWLNTPDFRERRENWPRITR